MRANPKTLKILALRKKRPKSLRISRTTTGPNVDVMSNYFHHARTLKYAFFKDTQGAHAPIPFRDRVPVSDVMWVKLKSLDNGGEGYLLCWDGPRYWIESVFIDSVIKSIDYAQAEVAKIALTSGLIEWEQEADLYITCKSCPTVLRQIPPWRSAHRLPSREETCKVCSEKTTSSTNRTSKNKSTTSTEPGSCVVWGSSSLRGSR